MGVLPGRAGGPRVPALRSGGELGREELRRAIDSGASAEEQDRLRQQADEQRRSEQQWAERRQREELQWQRWLGSVEPLVFEFTADLRGVTGKIRVEGGHPAELIAGRQPKPISYGQVSSIMFLNPEVAGVGLNEQECRRQGIAHRVARIDYSCLARAIAMRRTQGFFKVIVTDDEHMHILGMRAVGEHASSAIESVALLMHMGQGIQHLAELVHPHPSITEGVQESARILMGTSIFKPEVFGDRMLSRTWRPSSAVEQAA